MRNIIRQILKEETKITDRIKKMIYRLFPDTLVYTDHAKLFGGKNHFLSLIESLRKSHPNPLMSKDASFSYEKGTVKWEKVIFKEKVILLIDIINRSNEDYNLMPNEKIKGYKTIRNLLRTIGPMKFVVSPKNTKDGKGFSISPIEIIDSKTCRLNFMFEVLFFLPVSLVKKIYIGPKKSN